MPKKLIENDGPNAIFVAGRMILPGTSDVVDVPEDADAAHDETAVTVGDSAMADADAPLLALLEQKVGDVVQVLSGMTDDELIRLEAIETAGKGRKGVLAEVTVERLKRAAVQNGKGGDSSEHGDESSEHGAVSSEHTDQGVSGTEQGVSEGGAA